MLVQRVRNRTLIMVLALANSAYAQPTCQGRADTAGKQQILVLDRGGVVARAGLQINIDGSGRAYNWDNAKGLIHLCNAAKVYPAGASPYDGSVDNATCTGRFMADLNRIRAAGWLDGSVGAVQWYGVSATGSTRVNGATVRKVVPIEIPNSGGFLVSPTSLADSTYPPNDQRRYVDPLTVATAVIPANGSLLRFGVVPGTLGVAWHKGRAVPFIVSDTGPRIGEGSPALARRLAGLLPKPDLTREERFQGTVSKPKVVWVFFGGKPLAPPYTAGAVEAASQAAFMAWGGDERLRLCAEP